MTSLDRKHALSKPEALAEVAKTLGNPQRLMLLERLDFGELAVEKLAELSGLSVANTSQHLQQLRRAGFVGARRSGKNILYSLGHGPLPEVLAALQTYVDHQQRLMRDVISDSQVQRDRMEGISVEELLRRLADGSVVLIDVRPGTEFLSGHLPGAINIPLEDLTSRLDEVADGAEVVAYCRDPYCVLSVEAMAVLRASGKQADRLVGGLSAWVAAGMQVEAPP